MSDDFKIVLYHAVEEVEKKADDIMEYMDWVLKYCIDEKDYKEFKRMVDSLDKILTYLPTILRHYIKLEG